MKRHITIGAAIVLMVAAAAVTFNITYIHFIKSTNETYQQILNLSDKYKRIDELMKVIDNVYIGDIDSDAQIDAVVTALISGAGDKYGTYLSADEYETYMQSLNGEMVGIGVNIVWHEDGGGIRVLNVMDGSPALEGGIQINDLIVRVSGKDVMYLGYYDAVAGMKGEEGSMAVFTVDRDGEMIDFSIKREAFTFQSVIYRVLSDANIGYIRITEFDKATVTQFENAVNSLIYDDVEGIIFDVRGNPGGELTSICKVLDMLLPEGPIVRIQKKNADEAAILDINEINIPMAVLINGQTYSAAELFSAALKDYNKAVLVGTTTYGKGTMQSIYTLSDGSAASISMALYLPPFSENYEKDGIAPDGVEPDVVVEMSEEKTSRFFLLSEEEDDQLIAAIAEIRRMASGADDTAATEEASDVTEEATEADTEASAEPTTENATDEEN